MQTYAFNYTAEQIIILRQALRMYGGKDHLCHHQTKTVTSMIDEQTLALKRLEELEA